MSTGPFRAIYRRVSDMVIIWYTWEVKPPVGRVERLAAWKDRRNDGPATDEG